MSRGKKLILLVVLLVVSIAAYVIVATIQKNKPEEVNNDGEEVESDPIHSGYGNVFEFSEEDVRTIRIENANGAFSINRTPDNPTDPEFPWTIEGHEDWMLDHSQVNSTVDICTSLFANRVADEDAEANERNLEDFGLKDPLSTITVTFNDGKELTIHVGNKTVDGKFYYGMVDGDKAIYTLGRNAGNTGDFTARTLHFVQNLAINKENSELYYLLIENETGRNTEVNYVGISDKKDTMDYYNPGTRTLSYGENFAYDRPLFVSGNLDTIFQAMPDSIQPTIQIADHAKDLDQYGLGETPVHHVVLTYRVQMSEDELSQISDAIESGYDVAVSLDDFVYDEEMGATYYYVTNEYFFGQTYTAEDGTEMVYFRYADSDDVYAIEKSLMDQFDFEPYMYVQRTLYMNNIKNVKTMKVTIDGTVHNIEIKRGEATVDEEGNEQQDVVYKIDGKLIEEEAFKNLYKALIGIMSDYEIYNEKPEIDEDHSIAIDYVFLDDTTYSITFYQISEFYYVTQVKDDAWFACAYTQFDLIRTKMDELLNG